MSELNKILETQPKTNKKTRDKSKDVPPGQKLLSGLKAAAVVVCFLVLGIACIVLPWAILTALITDKSFLFLITQFLHLFMPVVIWIIVFVVTRRTKPGLWIRLRIQSGIGLFLAYTIVFFFILPWMVFHIAYKGVRM
ncbi:MAG: hypothetical protein GTO45_17925 [Candidatus Aminicenantes bacterium]|nr:hypothetical protein [Candidatus Aminicenantes bacterium]NIM80658.1 hypothetical protein [Candidatus Aminicenantes bacterium]NIN20039.1 hypothetical protein [Candidatus Aminicenantes bacterium]NIN43827.1 hypothetical protein [Candidatus Aminicenantes bacterium]NIN86637.1 hypothetical protein [Candidatus Aminicenantes bacterium]